MSLGAIPRCSAANIQEDEVDTQLWKFDGKIQKKRDDKLLDIYMHVSGVCSTIN